MNPFELGWSLWKKSFDAWENASTCVFETWMKSPFVLGPAGGMLSAMNKLQAQQKHLAAQWWSSVGLSNREDQERLLHALHDLQTRLLDLEDRLADAERGK